MTTLDCFVRLLDGAAARFAGAPRSGVLTGLLRPFAARSHVFVTDDDVATTVTIHKTCALDVEVVIGAASRHWSARALDAATGAELARASAEYGDRTTAAMCADLHTLLATLVDAAVRVAPETARLEIATATGWRPLTCFA